MIWINALLIEGSCLGKPNLALESTDYCRDLHLCTNDSESEWVSASYAQCISSLSLTIHAHVTIRAHIARTLQYINNILV